MDRKEELAVLNQGADDGERNKILIPIGVLTLITCMSVYALSNGNDVTHKSGHQFESRLRVDWVQAADGSYFSGRYGLPGESGERIDAPFGATRCWQKQKAYQCVDVVESGGIAGMTSVAAYDAESLPEGMLPFPDQSGYTCSMVLGSPQESIGDGRVTLTSNRLRSLDDRWSRRFVTKFMADNKVQGQWFDCLTVLREVSAGSLETLGTTLITKAVLPPG